VGARVSARAIFFFIPREVFENLISPPLYAEAAAENSKWHHGIVMHCIIRAKTLACLEVEAEK
jgi:hypothetical protein